MRPNPWRLPGPRAWLNRVLADFDDGGFLVLRLPQTWNEAELIEAVRDARQSAWLEPATVEAEGSLGGALRTLAFGAGSSDEALERLRADGTVAWLRAEGPVQTAELTALAEAHARLGATPPVPVVIEHQGPNSGERPPSSPTLHMHELYGVLSTLDTHVLLHEAVPSLAPGRREEVAELAAFDLQLAIELATADSASHERYLELCRDRAETLELAGGAPKLPPAAQVPTRHPGVLDQEWQRGAVDRFGGQAVLHPGIATDDDVARRLWRGQVRALLPFLDEVRLLLIEVLRKRGLYVVPGRGDTVELVDVLRALERQQEDQVLARAAREVTRARNDLAHLRLVDEERRQRLKEVLRRARLGDGSNL